MTNRIGAIMKQDMVDCIGCLLENKIRLRHDWSYKCDEQVK